MDEILKTKIEFEISQIDELLNKSSPLIKKCSIKEPDFIELNAIGSILHSYYNGLESIFLLINKNIDKTNISGNRWHSELLDSMFCVTEKRRAVFDENLKEQLTNYMGFRHFFRHAYGYYLRWDLAEPLLMNMKSNWNIVKESIEKFISL